MRRGHGRSLGFLLAAALAGAHFQVHPHGSDPMLEELFQAIRSKDLEAALRLVDANPALLARRNDAGISPLSWAAYVQQPQIVAALRSRRGAPDFYEACIVGDEEAAVASIAASPKIIDEPAPDGYTALGLAVFFGHPGLAKRLIAAGADVDARATNRQRVAPIHAALARGDIATLELLLRRGADPNLAQEHGIRPLHEAAMSKDWVATALLLMFGADPAITSDDGRRPADVARSKGDAALADRIEAAIARTSRADG